MNKPRILIWFVSNDRRFINGAMNILAQQHNGVDVVGVTAAQKITVGNLPFIPLNEFVRGGQSMMSSSLPVQGKLECRKL